MNLISKPKISVVIPCYNAEIYIKETVESVLNQSFIDFELIIVNDGSTDNTNDILNKNFKNFEKIKIITIENSGESKAFLEGVYLSRSKFVARLDADDLMLKNRLEVQYNYFFQHPEFDALGSWFNKFSSTEAFLSIERLPLSPYATKNLMCFLNQIANPTSMMKKSLFTDYASDGLKIGTDLNFWLKSISNNNKIGNVPKVLTKYRIHDKQATTNKELTHKFTNIVYDNNIDNLLKSDVNSSFLNFGFKFRNGVSIKELSLFIRENVEMLKTEELKYGNLDALSDCLFRVYYNSLGSNIEKFKYIITDFKKYGLNLNIVEKIGKLSKKV